MTQPSTTETAAVETIVDLLDQSDATDWTNSKPSRIAQVNEYTHKGRSNFADPALYVWSPQTKTITKFSADGDHMLDDAFTEILVLTLDKTKSQEYARDTVQFLSQYYNASDDTDFYTIAPTEMSDLRNEKTPRQTEHYLFSVQVEPRKLQPTG